MALELDHNNGKGWSDFSTGSQSMPFGQSLHAARTPSSTLASQNLPAESSPLTQFALEGDLRLTSGTAPLEEGFSEVEEPFTFTDGSVQHEAIRFVTKTGRKFLVLKSENPYAFSQMQAVLANRNSVEKLAHDDKGTPDASREAPALADVTGVEAMDDAAGTVVLSVRDEETGETAPMVFSAMENRSAWRSARAIALWLDDSNKAHREEVEALAGKDDHILIENDRPNQLPGADDIRQVKHNTDSNGNTLVTITTVEGKTYVLSSILSPENIGNVVAQMPVFKTIEEGEKAGFTLMRNDPDRPVAPTSVKSLDSDPETGLLSVEFFDGSKRVVDPQIRGTEETYGRLMAIAGFKASTPDHQRRVVEAAVKEGAVFDDGLMPMPSFDSIVSLKTERQPNGEAIVYYTVKGNDGKEQKHVVSSALTPERVDQLAGQEAAVLRMAELDGQGFQRPAADAPRIEAPHEAQDIAIDEPRHIVTWHHKGEDYALARTANPGLYDDMVRLKDFNALSFGYRDLMGVSGRGRTEALNSTPQPDTASLVDWSIEETAEGGVITYDVKPAIKSEKTEKFVVSSVTAPDHYASVKKTLEGLDKLKDYEAQGYRRATQHDIAEVSFQDVSLPDGPESDVILTTTLEGEKIVLHRTQDSILATKALAFVERENKSRLDILKQQFGLPVDKELDIRHALTDVKGNNGAPLSVTELAVKTIYEDYQSQIKSGEIDPNDMSNPKLQFVRLMEVQKGLVNGVDFMPYYEDRTLDSGMKRAGDGTVRKFADKLETYSPADMRYLVNEQSHARKLERLMVEDPTIQGDYDEALGVALKNTDTSQLNNEIYNFVTNPNLPQALNEAREKGLGDALELEISNYLTSLSVLDPAAAEEAQQIFIANSMSVDLEHALEEGTQIDEITDVDVETWAEDISKIFVDEIQAVFDADVVLAKMVTDAIKGVSALPRHSSTLFDKTWHETFRGNNTTVKVNDVKVVRLGDKEVKVPVLPQGQFGDAIKEVVKIAIKDKLNETIKLASRNGQAKINVPSVIQQLTINDVAKVIDGNKLYVPWSMRTPDAPVGSTKGFGDALKGFFGTLQSHGLWGSLTGFGGIAAGIWKLIDGRTGTSDERISIARDFLTFASVLGHVGNLTSAGLDQILRFYNAFAEGVNNNLGRPLNAQLGLADRNYTLANKMGFGLQLGEVLIDSKTIDPKSRNESYKNIKDRWGFTGDERKQLGISNAPDAASSDRASKPLKDHSQMGGGKRAATTIIKTVGVLADYAGLLDIYLGKKDLDIARRVGDVHKQTVAGLRIGAGSFLTGAAMSGTASLGLSAASSFGQHKFGMKADKAAKISRGAKHAMNVGNAFFWVGAIGSLTSLIIDVSLGDWRPDPAKDKVAKEQDEWWDEVDELGILNEDQLDMRGYATTLFSTRNGRGSLPYNEAIWEVEEQEYGHFKDTPEREGTAVSRMDKDQRITA
jgi:hypothetical protein